jgi:hypothetical protein
MGSRGSVFVDESTENIAAFDYLGRRLAGPVDRVRRKQGERSVRALAVVVSRVGADDVFEVAATKDQHPVETLDTDGAHEPLRTGVRLRCADRRADHLDPFAAEHLVEGGGELAVAIVDQETHPLDNVGEAEVARLLKDPGSGRIRRATGKVDAPAPELDEEEHIETTQRDRLDREEVAGEQARRVTAQKRRPAHRVTAWRGLEPGGGKQTPDRAWRDTETELEQLASLRVFLCIGGWLGVVGDAVSEVDAQDCHRLRPVVTASP